MDAPQSAQNQPVDGASIEEEQSQNAVSVDRELIPLQKAQALSKINTSPLHRCRRACTCCEQRVRQTPVCTVHCRLFLPAMVLVHQCLALLALLDKETAECDH
jgi:hypothetical protein